MAIESKMSRIPIGRPPSLVEAKKPFPRKWIIGVLIALVLMIAGYVYSQRASPSQDSSGLVSIRSGEYQAIFLDNGQVYFGKLEKTQGSFYLLKDVFYLQSNVAVEQASNLSLTKLGSEAHGPEDEMSINTEHILFIENMKNDSKVVQAIEQYKSKSNRDL